MTTTELAKRLSAVERDVAVLKSSRNGSHVPTPSDAGHPIHTLEAIHGTFEDDDSFREAMRLGRKWRDSLDSKAPKSKAKTSNAKPKRK